LLLSDAPVRRRPRPVGVIVIVLILALVGTAIVSIALDEGENDPIEITGAGTVQKLLGGIPQRDAVLGSESAPVTVELFNDLQCPDCADYQLGVVAPLVEERVRGGEVKLVFRHFSLSQRATGLAAHAATAAGEQGRQWQYVQLFYINQDEAAERGVTDELLERVASGVLELELREWSDARGDPEVAEAVEADGELAAQRRLPAEPAVVVHGPRGSRELVESPSLAEIEAAIAVVR
jgi:protein-disulfide isomerase